MKEYEGLVYIGDIVDMDGDGWVDMETAEMILAENGQLVLQGNGFSK